MVTDLVRTIQRIGFQQIQIPQTYQTLQTIQSTFKPSPPISYIMKNFFLSVIAFVFFTVNLAAQDYSDGIDNLMELKSVSEDLARAIQLEWDHNSTQYTEAKRLYNNTKNTVDNMVSAFDAKIRSGEKITNADIDRYVKKAADNCNALSAHYNKYAPTGGTNSLFGISEVVTLFKKIFDGVTGVIGAIKEHQIQQRLKKMHAALDPCRLAAWDNI